jgi:hypothetical protein
MALTKDTEGNKKLKSTEIAIYVLVKERKKIKDITYLHRFINGNLESDFNTKSRLTTYNKKLTLLCVEENEHFKMFVYANKEKVTVVEAEKCLLEVAGLYGELAQNLVPTHKRKTEKFAPLIQPISVKAQTVNTTIVPAMDLLTKKLQRLGNTTDVSTFHRLANESQVLYDLLSKWITDIQ